MNGPKMDLKKPHLESKSLHVPLPEPLQEFKKSLLETSDEFKADVSSLEGQISKESLKRNVERMRVYFVENCKIFFENKYAMLYVKLWDAFDEALKFLQEAEENMSRESAIEWMERLDQQIQGCFYGNECRMGKEENENEKEKTEEVSEGASAVVPETQENVDLNAPDKDEDKYSNVIRDCVDQFKQRLNAGPVHAVIRSLINKELTLTEAIDNLTLFACRGCNFVNIEIDDGVTPLLLAMESEDLNDDLLDWFNKNGADFNATEKKMGNSVLFKAIARRQSPENIEKIMEFGANWKHVNKLNETVIHMAARYGNHGVLEKFMEEFDVNVKNIHGGTPLHSLFLEPDLDYDLCLQMLLSRGADFGAVTNEGHVPLVTWIKFGESNCFTALVKLKDLVGGKITEDIASASLTAMVEEIERLQRFPREEVGQFFRFLVEEKGATLKLKNGERPWSTLGNEEKLEKMLLTKEFCEKMRIKEHWTCRGEFVKVKVKEFGMIDFYSKCTRMVVPIQVVLDFLLACRNYEGFKELCKLLKVFC